MMAFIKKKEAGRWQGNRQSVCKVYSVESIRAHWCCAWRTENCGNLYQWLRWAYCYYWLEAATLWVQAQRAASLPGLAVAQTGTLGLAPQAAWCKGKQGKGFPCAASSFQQEVDSGSQPPFLVISGREYLNCSSNFIWQKKWNGDAAQKPHGWMMSRLHFGELCYHLHHSATSGAPLESPPGTSPPAQGLLNVAAASAQQLQLLQQFTPINFNPKLRNNYQKKNLLQKVCQLSDGRTSCQGFLLPRCILPFCLPGVFPINRDPGKKMLPHKAA